MAEFIQHTPDTVSDEGADVLTRAEQAFGMVPNLIATMVESPATANGYLDLHERLSASSFSPIEQQVVTMTASFENECDYCMAAESAVTKMAGGSDETIGELRRGGPLSDDRLEALRSFTETVVEARGWAGEEAVDAFLDAGFTQAQVLEVVLGVAKKVLSNYTNHVAGTPVDEAFQAFAWERPTASV